MEKMFRPLRPNEVNVRVQRYTKSGAILLVYKDARTDMNLLDEAVGEKNWKCQYTNGNRNCTISVWDDDKKEWISKEGVGDAKDGDNYEKSLASDSMKRAGTAWGIGRELYTLTNLFAPCKTNWDAGKKAYVVDDEDKYKFFNARVTEMEFENDVCTRIVILDNDGNVAVSIGGAKKRGRPPKKEEPPQEAPKEEPKEEMSADEVSELKDDIMSFIEKTNTNIKSFLNYYGADSLDAMTPEALRKGHKALVDKYNKMKMHK